MSCRRLSTLFALVLLALLSRHTFAQSGDAFEQAMLKGEYKRAVKIAESTAKQNPQNSVAAYNVACACSRAGQIDRGIQWLLTSAQLGFSGVRSIRDDTDLDALRSDAGFAAVVKAVEANVARRFDAFRAAAEEAKPTIIMPPRYDPDVPAPLLIVLHGTGGTGKGISRTWRAAAAKAGAIIVAPDALRPQKGTRGYNWVFRDESEWLVLRTIEDARKKWKISKVVLAGFSQGANIAFMLGQSHAGEFDAVIPVCGHFEEDVAELPTEDPRPRWCLMIGARDPWVPTYDVAKRVFSEAGMTVRHDVVPGIGHAMPSGNRGTRLLREVLAWALESDTVPATPETP